MQNLALSLKARGEEGEPLPPVFHQLEGLGAKIRRGEVTLVAAAPNGGKSAFAIFYALKLNRPTLYISPDCGRLTFGMRVLSSLKNCYAYEAERLILDNNPEAIGLISKATQNLWVDFTPGPSPLSIEEETEAFAMVYGDYPHLIIIDNLMDVQVGGREHADDDRVVDFSKRFAKRTKAAVMLLCHVTGQDPKTKVYYTDGKTMIPRSGLMNKIDKRPSLVLTLHHSSPGILGASVVKNSNGHHDASGNLMARIAWLPERSWFGTGE